MQKLVSDNELRRLVPETAGGDLEAAERLAEGMYGHLMAFMYLLGVRHDCAEDLAQEICLKVYSNLSSYDTSQPFLPWMRTVARNTVKNYKRDQHKLYERKTIFAEYARTRLYMEEEEAGFAAGNLENCLNKLNGNNRNLVEMRYEEGLNSDDIASITGKKAAAVRKALSRIYDALRQCMDASLRT